MKFLFGFGFLAAFMLYFFGGMGGQASGLSGEGHHFAFDSDMSAEKLYREYDRFVPTDINDREKAGLMLFGSLSVKVTIEDANIPGTLVAKLIKVDGQKSTRYAIRLTPIEGTNKTHVEGEVENYPLKNDGRFETMKSETSVAELLKRIGGAPLDVGTAAAAFGAINNIQRDQATMMERNARSALDAIEQQGDAARREADREHDARIDAGLTPQGSVMLQYADR